MTYYLKLFAPLILLVILVLIWNHFVILDVEYDLIFGAALKGFALAYYLRLWNSNSVFINTLTALIIIMTVGEYYNNTSNEWGQYMFLIANLAFGLIFVIRQRINNQNSLIKIIAVILFCIGNALYITDTWIYALFIGMTFLISVYFYDRLTNPKYTANMS